MSDKLDHTYTGDVNSQTDFVGTHVGMSSEKKQRNLSLDLDAIKNRPTDQNPGQSV